VTTPIYHGVRGRLLILLATLAVGDVCAQSSSTVITVTARIIAPCTITSANSQSTCSEETLAQQSNVAPASARISTSDNDATVTHRGGLPPTIEKLSNQILLSF
jgi:hypothetical protein